MGVNFFFLTSAWSLLFNTNSTECVCADGGKKFKILEKKTKFYIYILINILFID